MSEQMMIKQKSIPILEFDGCEHSILSPEDMVAPVKNSKYCVISFFGEIIDRIARERSARVIAELNSEMGKIRIYELIYNDQPVAFFQAGVGAPLAAMFFEEAISMGFSKFVVCGGAGSLVEGSNVGDIHIPVAAVRDEGTSFHYLPPSREVKIDPMVLECLENTLIRNDISYNKSKTWTTDACYRETAGKIKMRRSEGCRIVEMESAALYAVAKFRKVLLGQFLYSGDDVSREEWCHRQWDKNTSVREMLFWLSVEACLAL